MALSQAFYLPGVIPQEYAETENITVKVNSLKSVETAVPYDYYSIMVCRPPKTVAEAENIGEILWGDSIKPSAYKMQMKQEVACQKMCTTRPNFAKNPEVSKSLTKLKKRIDDQYRAHLILDNLPVSEVYGSEDASDDTFYRRGYPLGIAASAGNLTAVHNHLAFTIKIHKPEGLPGWRIVGFEVVPFSIDSDYLDEHCSPDKEFDTDGHPPQTVVPSPKKLATPKITWTYSVHFAEDKNVAWITRWDHYLKTKSNTSHIHWFGIITSLWIVLCLSCFVAVILMRALHRDFNRYNNPDNDNEAQQEVGWKVVHGDVFRDPKYPSLLACYAGTGSQLLGMSAITIFFACFGFLSPARRGALMTTMLVLYAVMGFLGGYVTAVLAKMFHEQSWGVVFMTGTFFTGKVFGVFFVLNLMLWAKEASNAVPFIILIGLIALWFFVSLPLIVLGAKVGYSADALTHPKDVNAVPRLIPEQEFHHQPAVLVLCAGVVPFGAAFFELYFLLSSLWLDKIYYVFGFFALVFILLVITSAEIAIVLVYTQLCHEDYRWWWRSFLYPGSAGLYLFIYSIHYLTTTLNMTNFVSLAMYFGYMAVISYTLSVMCGTVGFLSTLAFVRYIYAGLRVD
jgi:transmembrane 9 superfamily protein 2/4